MTTAAATSELAIYRRLYDEKYQELADLLDGLPNEALLWKPFATSPWKGACNSIGEIVAHGVSSTVYLLRRTEYILGRCEWTDVNGDEGPEEFGPANHDVAYLRARVARTQTYVHSLLAGFTPADLDAARPHPQRPRDVIVRYDVVHALEHLSQHIGHGQLTRQLWAIHAGT